MQDENRLRMLALLLEPPNGCRL